nr:MAG TPA: hypothetical protein [Caudoviricetes sp.]
MDAVKFLEEAKRMCESYEECEACPANADGFDDCRIDNMQAIDAADAVAIVEKWSKENSIKTRSSEFLKHYPDATVDCHGMVDICPKAVDKNYTPVNGCCNTHCDGDTSCDECCYEYWMQEVE